MTVVNWLPTSSDMKKYFYAQILGGMFQQAYAVNLPVEDYDLVAHKAYLAAEAAVAEWKLNNPGIDPSTPPS